MIPRRRRLLLFVLAALVALGVLAPATAASAHAQLVSSEPADGSVVATAPPAITLTFGEGVETALGAVRLFDAQGKAVAVGPAKHPDGRAEAVSVSLPALGQGTYVVSWRVASADSHPVQGSFLFSVGQRSAVTPDATAALAGQAGSRAVGLALGASRFVVFAGFLLLAGGLAFVAIFRRLAPRTSRLTLVGAAAMGVGSLASIALQGGYADGTSLGDALRGSVFRETAQTAFGRQALLRVALATFGAALALVASKANRLWWNASALAVGPLAAATLAYAGHAHTGHSPAIGVVTDVVHLVALAWWLGGLAVVAVTALRASDGRDVLRRFSPLAFGCVVAVVVTGVVQSWRQVGSRDALATSYGRLLMAKVIVVVVLLFAASLTRRSLHRWTADLRPPSLLRRAVLGELALGLGVLGVTAGLVAAPPARDQVARPFNVTLVSAQGATANLVIDPARAGRVIVHLYVTAPGNSLVKAAEAKLLLSLASKGVNDLSLPLEDTGPNHFSSQGASIPFAGRWQITLTVRFGEFDSSTFATAVTVR